MLFHIDFYDLQKANILVEEILLRYMWTELGVFGLGSYQIWNLLQELHMILYQLEEYKKVNSFSSRK